MAEAKRTRQLPGWEAKVQAAQALRSLNHKTFEELTPEEKEQLLKMVAVKLQLIKPSEG